MRKVCASIVTVKADAILNAANGYVGVMGAGIAKAIRDAGGIEIEREARTQCNKQKTEPGHCYVTGAGRLLYKRIYHAVTMRYPGERSSISIIRKALDFTLMLAHHLGDKVIAVPSLGTGIGRVPIHECAKLYNELIPEIERLWGIEVIVADINRDFIRMIDGVDYEAT